MRILPLAVLTLLGMFLAGSAAAFNPHVVVANADGQSGTLATIEIQTPWTATTGLENIGGDPLLRHFFGLHYVVNRDAGTVQVIDPDTFDTIATHPVGPAPRDILVVGARKAYVTRFDSAELLEMDPVTGQTLGTIDLGFLGDMDGIPDMDTMYLDGHHLFVQIQNLDRSDPFQHQVIPPSYLAVIDVRSNTLVDADPGTAGNQALLLSGRRPAYKMFGEPEERRLYVSAPAGFFDPFPGRIEEIDLDALQSLGHITTEPDLQTLDLSAFTLVAPNKGIIVTHTELVESSHVTGFSRQTGTPVSQLYTALFGSIRNIVHDPQTSQIFLPNHTPDGNVGVVVFDALTDRELTTSPVDTGGGPRDLLVVRPVSPGESIDLRVESYDSATEEMELSYQPGCEAADHNVVFGPLDQVAGYAYSGQECGIGNLGSYSGFDPGPGSQFFLVVSTDGRVTAGSYGTDSGGTERPEHPGNAQCNFEQELTLRCDETITLSLPGRSRPTLR